MSTDQGNGSDATAYSLIDGTEAIKKSPAGDLSGAAVNQELSKVLCCKIPVH